MARPRSWSDDDLRAAVDASSTIAEVVRRLRLSRGGGAYITVRTRMEQLELTLGGDRDGRMGSRDTTKGTQDEGNGSRRWSEDQLRDAVGQARSLNDVFSHVGLVVGGSQWQVIRSLIIDRGWSTDHWVTPLRGPNSGPSVSTRFREALSSREVAEIVNTSSTRAEVIRRLGFEPNTTCYRLLRRWLRHHGLSIDHFEAPHAAMRRAERRRFRTSLDEILVEGSRYTNTSLLKRRLVVEGLLAEECAICGISEWRGRPLVLHLDHVNGIRDDNRLSNLRLLCPNCHSQTDTYAGRNQGRWRDHSERNGEALR